jgi:hypothetical protein
MKAIILIFALLLCAISYSQSSNSIRQQKDTTLNKSIFVRDSANNEIRVFGTGGYAPTAYTKKDSLFECKYKVKYVLYGCEPEFSNAEMTVYNLEVGKYLDRIWGVKWRTELHNDVIALKQ